MKPATSAKPTPRYILDTSALIAYLAEETGAERVRAVRHAAAIPFIALTELYYITWRQQDQALADRTMHHVLGWHLPFLTADEQLSLSAGYVKARYQLGVADSFIAAFALAHRAILVTKDPDFRVLQPELRLLNL